MLKKPAILFLLLLYLVTATGFSLNMHYCLGRLASIRIDAPARGCVTARQTKKMKCCSDKHFEVKVKDAHQNTAVSILGELFAFTLPPINFAEFSPQIQNPAIARSIYRGPPHFRYKPLYLKNQNFRI